MKSLLFFNIHVLKTLDYYFAKNVLKIEIYSNLEAYVCHDSKSNFFKWKENIIIFSSKFSENPFLNA